MGWPRQWERRGRREEEEVGFKLGLSKISPKSTFCNEVNKSLLTFVTHSRLFVDFYLLHYKLFVTFC